MTLTVCGAVAAFCINLYLLYLMYYVVMGRKTEITPRPSLKSLNEVCQWQISEQRHGFVLYMYFYIHITV